MSGIIVKLPQQKKQIADQSEQKPINRSACLVRLHELWQQERKLGFEPPPDEHGIDPVNLSDEELVRLGKQVAARVKEYQQPESTVIALTRDGNYALAREAAQHESDPRGALLFVDDAEQLALVEEIQRLWQEERAARWLNPTEEVTIDLNTLDQDGLQALRNGIATRIASRPVESNLAQPLPEGWWWVFAWQAWHHEYGTTAIHTERENALREVRRMMPKPAAASPGQPEERAGEDLFGEPIVPEQKTRQRRNPRWDFE
jgi:hypothetical protein